MLQSMTGFGGAAVQIDGVDYSVEIRSVNNRYFKSTIKLPDPWSQKEIEIERMLRSRLARGTVNFSLRTRAASAEAAYAVNADALLQYVRQVREALGAEVRLEAGALLQLPGVCVPPAGEDLVERAWGPLKQAVEEALDKLVEMRKREGEALHQDLMKQLDDIESRLGVVEQRKGEVVQEYHRRLTERVNELIAKAQLAVKQEDLVREVAVFAERSDVNEELSRLRGHIEQFRKTAADGDQAGRKLDFIGQELLREANTIGSKSNDVEIARAIVDIKSSIDRIKEQAANAV
jgi:uncharacterized protein (TIGR00255 family)